MLEPCGICGEATERGTCQECRQADRSRHKTARAQSILNVRGPILTPEQTKHAGTEWIDRAYREQRRD